MRTVLTMAMPSPNWSHIFIINYCSSVKIITCRYCKSAVLIRFIFNINRRGSIQLRLYVRTREQIIANRQSIYLYKQLTVGSAEYSFYLHSASTYTSSNINVFKFKDCFNYFAPNILILFSIVNSSSLEWCKIKLRKKILHKQQTAAAFEYP